ncbi:hypothetical protein B0T17DRAFT_495251 [Bombardia bombarda]|uniref:Rhoptry protein n=1 Tax=Bombardia bombarda TaxID=252184 RepID=A0AA39WN13_9PEZI|nr:hypothetical protein B0T17DRAFT_495251 [Bombardia bombarda]
MHEYRLQNNPFSSPPSSTGSHDTVSTTTAELTQNLSAFSFSPDGEGTRKFSSDDIAGLPKRSAARSGRFGSRPTTVVNTSAIARAFPEWSGLLSKDTATISQSINFAAPFSTVNTTVNRDKENIRPTTEQTDNDVLKDPLDSKRKRARADMQPRVENESDCSSIISHMSQRPALSTRRSRFSNNQLDGATNSPETPKRSLQDVVSKIRAEKQTSRNQTSPHDTTPKQSPPTEAMHSNQYPYRASSLTVALAAERAGVSPTGRSFFLPAFRHLPDWTSGTLKFSAMRNGVPVFVKSNKPGARITQSSGDHGAVNAVDIPEEDEELFVSMDKLQEEVRELHDHDAMLQREAEKLQREVNQLQSELKRFKIRKGSDSAIGSDSEGSFNRRSAGAASNQDLEEQIAQLRNRLDQASRQVGVNDIHSAALTAERDEALHQASIAREKAKKLQAELDAALDDTVHEHHEREALQQENELLLTGNDNLKQQHNTAVLTNKHLSAQCEKLKKELNMTREELASVRKQNESLHEEKKLILQDHASMERNNETYFRENKKLQAQVAARDQHIADLKKGISTRDQMIDNIHGLTTDTAVHEMNAELEAEVEQLKRQLQRQASGSQDKNGSANTKEGLTRALKEQNLELSAANQNLGEENKRLRAEYDEMRGQWIDDRHKVIRLNQLLTKNNTEYLKTLNDNTDDCVRLEEDFKQKEAALRLKLDRREAAVKKVKQLSSRISDIAQQEFITGKITKVTRIVEPNEATETGYAASEFTGKSSAMNVDDDPTTEVHLTQGSDFASIMDNELARLKQTYRDLEYQQRQDTDTVPIGNTMQFTEYDLPTMPVTAANQRDKSDETAQVTKGILKKSSQFALDEDTGRFSVKSALSIASHHSDDTIDATVRSTRSHRSASNSQGNIPRPESRLRRNSDTAHMQTEQTVEQNMTSAFFVPDITIQSDKQHTVPSLSKEARRILDGICKHKSGNCNVCVRIAAHGDTKQTTITPSSTKPTITMDDMRKGKKTVRVEKPTPVSDRMPETDGGKYDEEITMRPSMPPGDALAILIKETQDEIEHLEMELKRLNDVYLGLDKSLGQRERRRVMADIKRLQAEVETKSGQLYKLHDVLEGQKQAGQLMEGDEIDVTVLTGLLRVETNYTAESKESWNGFD